MLMKRVAHRELPYCVAGWASSFAIGVVAYACATPRVQVGEIGAYEVRAEEITQQRFALDARLAQQRRLDAVSFPLRRAALPLCARDNGKVLGIRFANVDGFPSSWASAARAAGFTDTLTIVSVAAQSGAEQAGVRVGDRIDKVAGATAPMGADAAQDLARELQDTVRSGASALSFLLHRGDDQLPVTVPFTTICAYDVVVETSNDLNAWTDGRVITVSSAMVRFAEADGDLATVVSHEIGHNLQGHVSARKSNSVVGAILGAVVDVAVATQGVSSGGVFSKAGAASGAGVFSQDFEREADYVGLYVLVLSGQPVDSAANLWRRMAIESPRNIKFATTHPTTAERFVRLSHTAAEIKRKIASGEPLRPTDARIEAAFIGTATEAQCRFLDVAEVTGNDAAVDAYVPDSTGRAGCVARHCHFPPDSVKKDSVTAIERCRSVIAKRPD